MNQSVALLNDYAYSEAPLLFARLDHEGNILEANTHTRTLLGGECAGKHIHDLILDFQQALTVEDLIQEGSQVLELDVKTSQNLPETYLVRFLGTDDGAVVLGQPDSRGHALLSQQVLELNRDLANMSRTLQKTNRELDRLNRLKNQFLGMAAHDLRGPSNIILGYSELLTDEIGDELASDQKECLDAIAFTSLRMARMIDDFLDVSMIESGKLMLRMAETDMQHVIRESIRQVEHRARQLGVDIETTTQHGPVRFWADADKLIQVTTNLLSNALDHSPEGTTIRLEANQEAGKTLIRIIDQGRGIPDQALKSIGEPYESRGAKRGGERGHGLGLAIAKKVVNAHHGFLTVEETGPNGTVFQISIPSSEEGIKEDL